MDSSSASMPRGCPYTQVEPTHHIARAVDSLSSRGLRCPPAHGGSWGMEQENEINGSAVSLSEPDDLRFSPNLTTNQETSGSLELGQKVDRYSVSRFMDAQNSMPLEFEAEMLRLLASFKPSTRDSLPEIRDQSQVCEGSLFSIAAEGLFRICMRKSQPSRREMRKGFGYSNFSPKAPQKLRKPTKREARLSLHRSVGRTSSQYLPILPIVRGLKKKSLTYQQALRSLPLVVKCVPEPLKRKLVARTKAKALRMAANLLKRWCF